LRAEQQATAAQSRPAAEQHTGSVTLIPHARAGDVLVIERPAPVLTASAA
jgi:hypothetical protein